MNRRILIPVAALALAAAAAGAGYWWAMHRMMAGAASASAPPAGTAGEERKPLYWHDPMYPQHKFDKPGRSPFMDMDLVPVYGDAGGGDEGTVAISPRVVQNLGVRTEIAREGALGTTLEAVGAVAFDERQVAVLQARVAGFVEKLHVRAPLDPVARGAPLVEILAPEWAAAQEEYLALRASPVAGDALKAAARQRLVLLGMNEATIAAIEREGKTRARVTLTAPISGVVAELGAREGMTVAPGTTLFRINGLSTVWVNAEIPESRAGAVRPGTKVRASVPAYPGETFIGTLTAILPEVNPTTRTVNARVELANPRSRLKPGMYATVEFAPQARAQAVLVPTEAVIRTGERSVVIVAEGSDKGPRFKPVDVQVGGEAGGMSEITKGLAAGTRVVTSGQFLIDSEASLKAGVARLTDAPPLDVHGAEGVVEALDKTSVTLSHGPIPSLNMGAMTMEFGAPKEGVPPEVKPGARVQFEFRMADDGPVITSIRPTGKKP